MLLLFKKKDYLSLSSRLESNENKARKELLKSVSNCLIMKTDEVKEKREMTLDDFIANSHVVE